MRVPLDGSHSADVQLRALGRLDRKGAPDTFDAWGYASILERLRSPRRNPGVDQPNADLVASTQVRADLVVGPTQLHGFTSG